MVNCRELEPGGAYEYVSNNDEFPLMGLFQDRKKGDFVCPVEIDSLELIGHYGSPEFDYVEVKLLGCNLGEGQCADDIELSSTTFDLAILEAIPNILGFESKKYVDY